MLRSFDVRCSSANLRCSGSVPDMSRTLGRLLRQRSARAALCSLMALSSSAWAQTAPPGDVPVKPADTTPLVPTPGTSTTAAVVPAAPAPATAAPAAPAPSGADTAAATAAAAEEDSAVNEQ